LHCNILVRKYILMETIGATAVMLGTELMARLVGPGQILQSNWLCHAGS